MTASKKKRTSPQRHNAIRACDTCKEKKTRCSGTLPCMRCYRLALQCEYQSSYSRGLATPLPPPLDPSDSHPVGIEGYPPPLQQRSPGPRVSLNDSLSQPEAHGSDAGPASGLSFLNRVCEHFKRDKVASSNQSAVPVLSTTPNPEVPDASSVFSFGDKPYSAYYVPEARLPPFERAMDLTAIYFDVAVVTYRFLHRGLVEQWVRELYKVDVPTSNNLPTGPLVARMCIVFSIFAIGTLYDRRGQADQVDSDDQSERWFAVAKHLAALESGPPRLETVQARLNQCLYLLASSRVSEGWFSFGLTVQLVTALGLHRASWPSVDRERAYSYLEQELRKRTFWSVYTLDRYISVTFGRPQVLHDEDIDQELPDEVNDDDLLIEDPAFRSGKPDHIMVSSVLHYGLIRILGTISRQLYSAKPSSQKTPLERTVLLILDLERWKESVPESHDLWRSRILQMAYSHAVIHATRSLLFIDVKDVSQSAVPSATVASYIQKCTAAAEDIMTIVDELANQAKLIQGFWFTHYACFCAVTVIYIYMIRQHEPSAMVHVASQRMHDPTRLRYLFSLAETCQQHLGWVTSHSSRNRRYGVILEELRLEVHRRIVSHLRPSQPVDSPDTKGGTYQYPPNEPSINGESGTTHSNPSTVSSPSPWRGIGMAMGPDILGSGSMEELVNLGDPTGFFDNVENSILWTQLDSLAYSNQVEEPSIFRF